MSDIKIFENSEFGKVRVQLVDGEPMFCLSDVCKVLDLSNPTSVSQRLDDDERTKLDLGRQGETTFVNESGLYSVILRSDKPNSKSFRKWVTSEVLPSIRRTGSYSVQQNLPQTYLEALKALVKSEEEKERISLENKRLGDEVTYKEDVIIGLVEDIDLATKRQRISQIVKHGVDFASSDGVVKSRERYSLLYREFELKYHVNLSRRIKAYNSSGKKPKITNKVDYIDKVMNKIPQLYEIACKFFENDVESLKKEWSTTVVSE